MRRTILLLLLVSLSALLLGDVVHTTDGRKIKGRIVREDDEVVVVRTRYGDITVNRDDIDRIERGELPEDIYRKKAKELANDDAEGHYRLGLWCKENGLRKEAEEEFKKAVKADPDHEGARKELGYTKVDGRWVLPRKEEKTKKSSAKKELSSSDVSQLLKLVKDAVQNGLSDRLKERLKASDGLSEKDFEKVAEVITEWKRFKEQSQTTFTIQSAGMETYIHLPEKYNPKKAYPLILVLHGAGDTGRNLRGAWANTRTDWGQKVRANYIVAAPTWRPARWWEWPRGKDIYTVLEDVKNAFNVDTNRVILTGFSNGGHSTWSLGMKQPSLFAGLAPQAGLPVSEAGRGMDLEMLAALMHLPVFLINSADDRICPAAATQQVAARYRQLGYNNFTHKEFPSGGHTAHFEFWGKLFEWIKKRKRVLYPKKFVFFSDHQELDTAYWLRLEGISRRAKVSAEVKANTVSLKVENATRLTVYLSDRIVDLDRPVRIVVNGKKQFSGLLKRSAATAVEEALRRNDRHAVFAAAVEVDVP